MKLIGIVALFTASFVFAEAIQSAIKKPDAIGCLQLVLGAALFLFVVVIFSELY